jgi:hypothetical protein
MIPTATWLAGMLAIASVIMCIGIWPLLRAEIRESPTPMLKNKALRLAFALWLHGVGSVVLFTSTIFGALRQSLGIEIGGPVSSAALWLAWLALGLWLVAKTMIVAVSGRLRLCIALFVLWTAGCLVWRLVAAG